VSQRDANATWEAVAGEFGPVLAAYREMLGGNEEVTLFCAKRVIKRTWEQAYLNRVRVVCVCRREAGRGCMWAEAGGRGFF
jgi:hypothetical protein